MDVGDEIILLHFVAGFSGNSRLPGLQQQCAITARQAAGGCGHATDNIRLSAFDTFVPAIVPGNSSWDAYVVIEVAGALGKIVDILPGNIFKGVTDDFQLRSLSGYKFLRDRDGSAHKDCQRECQIPTGRVAG